MSIKMMIRCALVGATALLTAACFSLNDVGSKSDRYIQVFFEPENAYDYSSFLSSLFDGGKDTVSVNEWLYHGPIYFHSNVAEDGSLIGGFALCYGTDTLSAPDHKPSRYAVFDKSGNSGSFAYVVFQDTIPSLMPEHAVQVYLPNGESSCVPVGFFVQNTNEVVMAVLYGTGLSGGPFTSDDYLQLTVTATLNGTAAGQQTIRLVDGTRLLDGWTEVELKDFSPMDAMDLKLTSSRPDMPLSMCLDDCVYHYVEIY